MVSVSSVFWLLCHKPLCCKSSPMTSPPCPTTASGRPRDHRSPRLSTSDHPISTTPQASAITPSDRQAQTSVLDFSALSNTTFSCRALGGTEGAADVVGACQAGACACAACVAIPLSAGAVCRNPFSSRSVARNCGSSSQSSKSGRGGSELAGPRSATSSQSVPDADPNNSCPLIPDS